MAALAAGFSLYAHFPWCVKKCPYCDFNSHPLREPLQEQRYLQALVDDLNSQTDLQRPISVFFGGGTPSLFSPTAFAALLDRCGITDSVEVTMEANPGTTEHANFTEYRAAGINRISLGAQSFDNQQLKRLGRIHEASETKRAFELARAGDIDNINLDLMYALPEQSAAAAINDLEQAIELAPEHISWYQLTLEPKTEFAKKPPILPKDAEVELMEREGHARLREAGYERYEVSAYAKAGKRCAHNLNYWSFGDYLGLGAGAHGKRAGVRTRKVASPRAYMNNPTAIEQQPIASQDVALEYLMNVLRLVDGRPFDEFEAKTGLSFAEIQTQWQSGVANGLLRADRIATTQLGFRHLDSVLGAWL